MQTQVVKGRGAVGGVTGTTAVVAVAPGARLKAVRRRRGWVAGVARVESVERVALRLRLPLRLPLPLPLPRLLPDTIGGVTISITIIITMKPPRAERPSVW